MKKYSNKQQFENTLRLFNIENGRHGWNVKEIDKDVYSVFYVDPVSGIKIDLCNFYSKYGEIQMKGQQLCSVHGDQEQSFLNGIWIGDVKYNFIEQMKDHLFSSIRDFKIMNRGDLGELKRFKIFYSKEKWNEILKVQELDQDTIEAINDLTIFLNTHRQPNQNQQQTNKLNAHNPHSKKKMNFPELGSQSSSTSLYNLKKNDSDQNLSDSLNGLNDEINNLSNNNKKILIQQKH